MLVVIIRKQEKKKSSVGGAPCKIPVVIKNKKKEKSSVGEPLAKFWLFPSVSRTDTTLTKEKKLKRRAQWGNPLQNFGCYQNKDKREKRAQWGNPLQNVGCYHKKYLKGGKSSVGEPLAKFWLLHSVSRPDTTSTKEEGKKRELSGGTPCKILVAIKIKIKGEKRAQ